jgi:predicted DCC family thiol-disulfide oxidoreductase YuxK
MPHTPELTLYYDGQCPLCQAEIHFLQSRNGEGKLDFVDVTEANFAANAHHISCEAAMAQIHGRLANGQVLVGVPVFAQAYQLARLPVLAWILSRPWLQPVLGPAYVLFAKHRHTLSKRFGPALLRFSKRFFR